MSAPEYVRAVLNEHLAEVMAKLVAVRVTFRYAAGEQARYSSIGVPDKHAATLARCIDQLANPA